MCDEHAGRHVLHGLAEIDGVNLHGRDVVQAVVKVLYPPVRHEMDNVPVREGENKGAAKKPKTTVSDRKSMRAAPEKEEQRGASVENGVGTKGY